MDGLSGGFCARHCHEVWEEGVRPAPSPLPTLSTQTSQNLPFMGGHGGAQQQVRSNVMGIQGRCKHGVAGVGKASDRLHDSLTEGSFLEKETSKLKLE